MLDGCSTNTSLKSYSWKCSSLLVIDFLLPTYKVAIGTPEFKQIWLSATFVILPPFASFPLQNHADEFKIPRFFLFHLLRN